MYYPTVGLDKPPKTIYTQTLDFGDGICCIDVFESAGVRYLRILEPTLGDIDGEHQLIVPEEHLQAFHQAYFGATQHFDPLPRIFRQQELREKYRNAYKKWTVEEDIALVEFFSHGLGVEKLVEVFGRTKGAILFRLVDVGLIPA